VSWRSSCAKLSPASRRLQEPLLLEIHSGRLELVASWQLARETKVTCNSGRVLLDLTGAIFDDLVVDLDLRLQSGTIEVVVPYFVDVQMVRMKGQSGRVENKLTPNGNLPGGALIRVKAQTRSGRIILRRPKTGVARNRRRRWFGRRATTDAN
jgi:hypothetical protein